MPAKKDNDPPIPSISPYWALVPGLLAVAGQLLIYYLRFQRWNTGSPLTDYLLFFVAGALGGSILIFFLNRQTTLRGRWVVFVMFPLISPIALLVMLAGGLFGPLGILIFPQVPWALFAWLGSLLGKLISRPRAKVKG